MPSVPTPEQVAGRPPAAHIPAPPHHSTAAQHAQQPAVSGAAAGTVAAGRGSTAAVDAAGTEAVAARANKIAQKRLQEALLSLGEAADEPEGWHSALKKLRRAGKGGVTLKVGP